MTEYYESLKQQGYRILSLAYTDEKVTTPSNMKLIGHVVLSDEIKANTKETFKYFESQGVAVKIISGDNHIAVLGVAKKAGFKEDARAVDMTKVTEENFESVVLENDIFWSSNTRSKTTHGRDSTKKWKNSCDEWRWC